jgi:polyisoprenoid-binding protein YceI
MVIRQLIFILISLFPIIGIAAPAWQILPSESSITFTGMQNSSPVLGQFTSFNGELYFDPADLSTSNVTIMVDMGSVTATYGEVSDALKNPEWFNIKLFPQAVFKSTSFVKTGEKTYKAQGTLTLRNKTLPVVLIFSLDDSSPTKTIAKGETTLKRLAFGVGQGEWTDTNEVQDDVKVSFTLAAVKK